MRVMGFAPLRRSIEAENTLCEAMDEMVDETRWLCASSFGSVEAEKMLGEAMGEMEDGGSVKWQRGEES